MILSKPSNEADERLDPEEFKEISTEGSGESSSCVFNTSCVLNLKSRPEPRQHCGSGQSVFLNLKQDGSSDYLKSLRIP